MKIPKPRLRQVFEHSTHFKVAKPGGAMITIPKKALSPTMLGKLRRYAQGGEVQKYADGVEVPDASEAAALADVAAGNAAASQPVPASAPVEEVAPQTLPDVTAAPAEKRRVVRADEATGNQLTAEQFAAQDRARMAAQQAPAPVVVNVNTAPAPVPAPPAPTPAKAEEKPVEKPAEPAKDEAAPAPAPAPAPVAAPAPAPRVSRSVPIEEVPVAVPVTVASQPSTPGIVIPPAAAVAPAAPAAPPIGSFLGKPGLLAPSLVSPELVAPVAAPVVPPVVAAPTVAPAAPAGALPVSPAMAPVLPPSDLKRVTPQEVREYKAKNPTATFQQAASVLTGGLTFSPLELTQIASIAAQTPEKVRDDAVADLINAKVDEAHAVYDQAVLEAQQAETRYERGLAAAAQTQANIEALKQHGEAVRKEAEENDDIKSFWGNQGFWRSVLGIASLAVSGYAAGYAGIENFAYKAFENAVAKDVEEQKRKRSMRWKQYETILGNTEDAEQLYKADLKEVTAAELERLAKYGAVKQVGPQYNAIIAKLRLDAARERELLGLKEQRVEAETTRAEAAKISAARPRAAPRAPTPPSTLPRERWETGRTFAVDDIPVKAPSTEGMTGVRDSLGSRNYAVGALEQAVKEVESLKPGQSINVLSQERQKALATLALQIENFSQAFGIKRAISVNAKTQLEKALANPTGLPAALKNMFGDVDLATGIRQLRDEVVDAREKFIASHVDLTDPKQKDAANYGLWKLRSKEAKLVGRRPPPLPKLSTPIDQLEVTPSTAVVAPTLSPGLGAAPTEAPAAAGGWRSVARPVAK